MKERKRTSPSHYTQEKRVYLIGWFNFLNKHYEVTRFIFWFSRSPGSLSLCAALLITHLCHPVHMHISSMQENESTKNSVWIISKKQIFIIFFPSTVETSSLKERVFSLSLFLYEFQIIKIVQTHTHPRCWASRNF